MIYLAVYPIFLYMYPYIRYYSMVTIYIYYSYNFYKMYN